MKSAKLSTLANTMVSETSILECKMGPGIISEG